MRPIREIKRLWDVSLGEAVVLAFYVWSVLRLGRR